MPSVEAILQSGFDDFRELVNAQVALRAELTGEPTHLVGTASGRMLAADGRAYEDLHGTQALGHRNPVVGDAVRRFLDSDSPSWFPSRVNPYAGSLARRLCERTGYSNAFFASSGTEGVEAALKLCRAATGRPRLLALERAYHGCTMGSCSLMGRGAYRELFAPHLEAVSSIPAEDLQALERALASGEVAGVIVEPIQLEGGVRPLSPGYVAALGELTARHGALLVADEVQTGLGRTGRFLASEVWPRRPDAVVLGKLLGGGLLPISAMLTRKELFEAAYGKNFETAEAHNVTFSGSALPAVAAHATLDLLTDELLGQVAERGRTFRAALREALTGLPLFREVRGAGFITGVELEPIQHPWLSFEHFGMADLAHRPAVGALLCHRLYRRGYVAFVCGLDWGVLRLLPRYDIPDEALADLVKAVREELVFLSELS